MIETIIPAFIPVITDGVRALFNRFTGGAGAKPANVEEAIQLMGAETDRLKAIAELDKAEGVSQWVANIRAMQRPTAVVMIIGGYVVAVGYSQNVDVINAMQSYVEMVTFYLFGDRTYRILKKT